MHQLQPREGLWSGGYLLHRLRHLWCRAVQPWWRRLCPMRCGDVLSWLRLQLHQLCSGLFKRSRRVGVHDLRRGVLFHWWYSLHGVCCGDFLHRWGQFVHRMQRGDLQHWRHGMHALPCRVHLRAKRIHVHAMCCWHFICLGPGHVLQLLSWIHQSRRIHLLCVPSGILCDRRWRASMHEL